MKKNLHIIKKIALTLVLLVSVVVVNAQKTAIVSGPWSSNSTWGGSAPSAGQTVTINSGVNVTVDGTTANVASVTVNGTLTVGTTANTVRTLNVAGDLTVSSTGIVQIGTGNATHIFNIGGNISNAGSIDLALDGNSICNTVFNGTANQTISGAGTRAEFNRVTLNNSGATNNVNNIVEFTASNLVFPADFLTLTDGTFKLSSGVTLDLSGNNLNLTAPDGFVVNNSSAIVNIGNNDITIGGGIFQLIDGTVSLGNGNDLFGITSGSCLISGGTLNVLGQFQMSGGSTTITGGNVAIDPGGTLGSTSHIFEAAAAAAVTFTAGTVTVVDPHTATGTGNAIQITSGVGAKNFAGSTISLGNGVSTSTGSTDGFDVNSGGVSLGNLIVNNPSGTNRAVRYVTNAPTFSGNVTITAGTLNVNSLNQTVSGNWSNSGTFTPGTQTITFNGTSLQTLTGATTFSSVTVNNTGAGLSLASNVTVSGTLTLTDGVVATSPSALITLNAGATVSGGSVASHVNGPLAKTGSSDFSFPVGDGTHYRPITMTSLTNATGSSVVTARYILGNPRTAFGMVGVGASQTIKDISLCEYWDLNDGAESISAVVGLQYSSTSPCNTNGYITDPSTLLVAHFDGSTWESLGAASATLTNMTAAVTSGFSPFTIGTTNPILNPLPVSFTDVKAAQKAAAVQIDWTNSTESDINAYLIERSADGINFSVIGQTAPRSNQFDKVSYTHIDAAPLSGTNFYRIKAIELSGKNVYSKALRVDIGRSPKGISLYPNPVRGSEITIGFTALKGQYSLNLVNTAGQVVYRQSLNHAGGTVAQTVNLPASLKAGVYNVLISGDNYKETRTFVIQ